MKRHRVTDPEADKITRFLKRHSGDRPTFGTQCRCRRKISDMTDRMMADLLYEETGLSPSRPWLAKTCDDLGVERRKRPGPPPMPSEEKRGKNTARWQRWVANFRKTDPKGYEEWLATRRKKRAKQPVAA